MRLPFNCDSLHFLICAIVISQPLDCGSVVSADGGTWQSTDTLCASISCPVVYKLLADGGEEGDYFGEAVSIYGDYMVIGAPSITSSGSVDSGTAYVYQKHDTH